MKVLIVDDEPIEREGMRRILSVAFEEVTILDAKNGYQAIELVQAEKPDIVLMDIMMPGINGIEALQQIQQIHPSIRGVMVTAFDTFDYARQALRLGVKDYLLKPSKRSEIIATVESVMEQVREEAKKQQSDQQAERLLETELVTQLLFHHVNDVQLDALMETVGVTSQPAFVAVLYLPEPSEDLYRQIKERVHRNATCLVGALYGKQLPIIVFRRPDLSYRGQAMPFAQQLIASLREQQGIFIGVGEEVAELSEVASSYQQAVVALASHTQSVRFRFYEENIQQLKAAGTTNIREKEQQFFEALDSGDWPRIERLMNEFIDEQEHQNQLLIYSQQRVLELFWIIQRALENLGMSSQSAYLSFQSTTYRQLRAEVQGILSQISVHYGSHLGTAEFNKVQIVKRYIEEHSHEELSLDRLAELVGFTPMYLSKLFKDKLGINYIDYLTECRIQHAKQLLRDPEKSLKEITYEVGYHEPNYFSKVFKKMCGVTPSEYRKQSVTR